MAFVEVTVKKGAQLHVQHRIADMNGVVAVYDVTGMSDSLVFVKLKSRTGLSRLVKAILAIPEVERTNTRLVLNVIKEDGRTLGK